jgi:hypothetical protein
MTDREIRQEFKQLRDMIFQTNQRLSMFNDLLHKQQNETIEQNKIDIEDAVIENEVATNERITDIEDAILELDEAINGGADNG